MADTKKNHIIKINAKYLNFFPVSSSLLLFAPLNENICNLIPNNLPFPRQPHKKQAQKRRQLTLHVKIGRQNPIYFSSLFLQVLLTETRQINAWLQFLRLNHEPIIRWSNDEGTSFNPILITLVYKGWNQQYLCRVCRKLRERIMSSHEQSSKEQQHTKDVKLKL